MAMIPRVCVEFETKVPEAATFWTPRSEDISEEGFAYFRDTRLIRGVGANLARDVIREEARLLALAGRFAADDDEFDAIAHAMENGYPEDLPDRFAGALGDELRDAISDIPAVECLEIGVAGLVYALSSAGFWPAASCRGHPGGWSEHPVIYFAADRHRTLALQRLAAAARSGFQIDFSRGDLLAVVGSSVEDTALLATLVVDARADLVPRRGPRSRRDPGGIQQSLWDG